MDVCGVEMARLQRCCRDLPNSEKAAAVGRTYAGFGLLGTRWIELCQLYGHFRSSVFLFRQQVALSSASFSLGADARREATK
jgi:hypothetical protein